MVYYSDMTIIALLAGVVIPLLVGVITKLNASPGVKAVLNAGLSAAASLLATVSEIDFNWRVFAINWGFTWAISIATYYGLWKPTGVSGEVQEKTADFGVG